jgi:CIC family chloride channel protein
MPRVNKPGINLTSVALAVPIGVAAALVTLMFRGAIDGLTHLLFGPGTAITESINVYPWYLWPLIVGVGGVVAGLFLRAALRIEKTENVRTDYLEVIDARLDRVPTRTSLLRSLSSLASIASGASIGREGPMVQLCALCGSWLGKYCFRVSPLRIPELVAMAAAGGLAAVYHAPLAASIFVAEIAFGATALQRIIPLIICAGVAVLTMSALGYDSALYPLATAQFVTSPASLLLTAGIGLLCGLMGVVLIYLIGKSRQAFATVPSLPLRLGLGGVLVGLLASLSTQILGNGYEVILQVMAGDFLLHGLGVLLVLKVIATSISAGSNAVGGLFTPSLLIGALLGMLVASCCKLLGLEVGAVELYAAIGMGAVLAAVSQAPLMAMLMVFEMTLNSSLLLAVMIACVIASAVALSVRSPGSYPVIKSHLRKSDAKLDFDNSQVAALAVPGIFLGPDASVGEALALSSLKKERFVYIVDARNRFLGAVSIHDISSSVLDGRILMDTTVDQIMDSHFPLIEQSRLLSEAWDLFATMSLERLPVIDNRTDRQFCGVLTKTRLIQQAKRFM